MEKPCAPASAASRRVHRELLLRNAIQHDREPQKVSEQLFIGSVGCVVSPGALAAYGITHVLCVSAGVKEEVLQSKAPGASISVAPLRDSVSDPSALLQALPMLLGFLATVIHEGEVILVCSFRGWSRAAAIVIAHLMLSTGISMREAAAFVAYTRPHAAPNSGFVCALLALEAALTAECLGDAPEIECEQLRSIAEAAISALPHFLGEARPVLDLGGGRELELPEGLDDLSPEVIADQVGLLQRQFGLDTKSSPGDGNAEPQERPATASSSEEPTSGQSVNIAAGEALPVLQAQREELLRLKQQAIAADDFEAAAQARDALRVVEAQLQQLSAAPAATEEAGSEMPNGQLEQHLRARREELLRLKQQAIDSDDFAAAAQARDGLRSLDSQLQELGATTSSEAGTGAESAGSDAAAGADAEAAAAVESSAPAWTEPPRRASDEERLQKLLEILEARRGHAEDEASQLVEGLATSSSSQEPKALTLWHKLMLYPVVVILVLLGLMVLHTALIEVVLRFAPGQEI